MVNAYRQNQHGESDGPLSVIESYDPGVSFTSLDYAINVDSLAVLRPTLSNVSKAQAIYRAFSYIGRPYDFNFDFITDNALVCSELVAKSYASINGVEGIQFKISQVLGAPVISPNSIVQLYDEEYDDPEPQLKLVWFLDGDYSKGKAIEKSDLDLRHSWKRPKWHIMTTQ